MTEFPSQPPRPLELDRVQSSRASAGEVRLRLSGRWLDGDGIVGEEDELLVVNVGGRRHRFPASEDEDPDLELPPGSWTASFTLPIWAEPREQGQAALWLGGAVIPVPPPQQPVDTWSAREGATADRRPREREDAVPPEPAPESADPLDPPRSGPLADLLLEETVSALHSELEQRTADATQIRGSLASAQSELEIRARTQAQLESTLGELRSELDRLRTVLQDQHRQIQERSSDQATLRERLAVAEQTAERRTAEAVALRGELAAANVSREAAISEAAGLRAELERIGSELAVTHEQATTGSGDLGEAGRLLADARALAAELRAQGAG